MSGSLQRGVVIPGVRIFVVMMLAGLLVGATTSVANAAMYSPISLVQMLTPLAPQQDPDHVTPPPADDEQPAEEAVEEPAEPAADEQPKPEAEEAEDNADEDMEEPAADVDDADTDAAAKPKAKAGDEEGLTNEDLFANFLHNSVIGKFKRADAYAQKLLAANPDPVEILGYADKYTNSMKTLLLLVNKVEVSDSAKKIIEIIHQGELALRQDPQRIKDNIQKLGGDPQTEFNAINRLIDSGEYAVPWLISTLQDKAQSALHARIIRMFPRLGKAAVNPLVMALKMDDMDTRQFVVKTLGQIGYPQAIPYLLTIKEDTAATPELKQSVETAIADILAGNKSAVATTAAEAYVALAAQYYVNHGSVQADLRVDFANVWYWQEGRLERIEVPTRIFDEIMAMRCSEEALKLQPDNDVAIAHWLAANIRREAELGQQVEAVTDAADAAADPTKPTNFPRSTYFARSAGARYCHMVLDLALQNQEPAVALGAIAALRLIAGETNLIGTEDFKQPLAQALAFPDLVVRIKAALALGQALPKTTYAGADRVIPVLAEALAQTGGQYVLVIDSDTQNLNRVMDALRSDRSTAIGETTYTKALERARTELPTLSVIFLASDLQEPGLVQAIEAIRANSNWTLTPIVILTKPAQSELAQQLIQSGRGVASVVAAAPQEELQMAWQSAATSVGQTAVSAEDALALALDAVSTLRMIAFSNSTVYDFSLAEGALIKALASEHEVLQIQAASVLALAPTSSAQQAIATLALEARNTESLRVAAFASLAESAKVNGNLLSEVQTDQLITMAINEENLVLRTAASQALGALNVPSNKAAPVIQKYHRG